MIGTPRFTPHGRHLIAGEWIAGGKVFASSPAHGPAHDFSVGTPALVAEACAAAEDAFWSFGYSPRADRAAFLDAIADEIENRAAEITEIGTQETWPPRSPPERRARAHHRPAAPLREPHPRGRLPRSPDRRGAA